MKKLILVFAVHALLGFIGLKALHQLFYPNNLALFVAFFIFGLLFFMSSRLLSLRFFYFATQIPHKYSVFSFKTSIFNEVGLMPTLKIFWKNIVLSFVLAIMIGLIMSWFKDKTVMGLIATLIVFKYDHNLFDKNAEEWIEECKLQNKQFQVFLKIAEGISAYYEERENS